MDFKKYIKESEKRYELRLKTIVPLDDKAMDAIEAAVVKYQPLKLSSPKKTILQSHPVDFVNITSGEVYIVDMVFGLPVSANVMREDIRKALEAPETFVVIRYPNDAIEIEGERKEAANQLEKTRREKNMPYASLLSTTNDYPEYEEADQKEWFGDEYNSLFLSYLEKVRKEREDAEIKSKNVPFVWLDIPDREDQEPVQDSANFNAHVKGAPEIKPNKPENKTVSGHDIRGSANDRMKVTRLYKDKNGDRVAASVMMGEKE